MKDLIKYIVQLNVLTEKELEAFSSIVSNVILNRKDLFLETGSVCFQSAFIYKGLFKTFRVDSEGREKIIQLNSESTFISDCNSYTTKKPTIYSIEALEKSKIIVFNNADFERLCLNFPVFDRIGRRITQEIMTYHKEHLNLLMMQSPKERYNYIMTNMPGLIKRVSVTNLAKFLGLTRETVSRLRGHV